MMNMMYVFNEKIDAVVAISERGIGGDTWPT